MPFVKGQSGNPGGRSDEREFANALRAAVNAEDPRTKRRKLLAIADAVVDAAANGESWAVNVVADRLDGKPHQTSDVTVRKQDLSQWTDEEIVARLTELRDRRGDVAGADASQASGTSKPH